MTTIRRRVSGSRRSQGAVPWLDLGCPAGATIRPPGDDVAGIGGGRLGSGGEAGPDRERAVIGDAVADLAGATSMGAGVVAVATTSGWPVVKSTRTSRPSKV